MFAKLMSISVAFILAFAYVLQVGTKLLPLIKK